MNALNVLHDVDAIDPGFVEAGAPEDRVPGAVASEEQVVARPADDVVAAQPARQAVVADAALQDVVPAPTVELVVAGAPSSTSLAPVPVRVSALSEPA